MKPAATRPSTSETAEYDKYVWEVKDKTFVYTNKRGCSGRAMTPSEASDLLVLLLQG